MCLFLALADDDHVDFLADRRVGYDARQIVHLLDVVTVEFDDHVTRFDAAGLRRTFVVDSGDESAMRRLDAKAFGDVVGDLLDAHAEPAAARLAVLAELVDDGNGARRRHRETDTDRAARGRNDRGVDADDFAVEVEQRTAGIAPVDGGVGLDVVVVRTRVDVAVARRDDTCGHGAAETERVADGDDPFAKPQLVGIAEFNGLERLVGVHAQQREIALCIPADQLGGNLGAVVENDVDLVSIGDDMVVGDDEAGRIDDKTGTERVDAARGAILIAGRRLGRAGS